MVPTPKLVQPCKQSIVDVKNKKFKIENKASLLKLANMK